MHNKVTVQFKRFIEGNTIKPATATDYKCRLVKSLLQFTS